MSGTCCGPNEIGDGLGNCVCRPTFTFGPITKKCLCNENEVISNGTCVCVAGFIRNASNVCVCPPGEILDSGACLCDSSKKYVRNPVTLACECPPHEILINGTCDCAVGFRRDAYTSLCEPIVPISESPVACLSPSTQQRILNCTALIPYREINGTDAIMNLFGSIFNIVETGHGNINNIIVAFHAKILAIMGFTTPALEDLIATFVETLIPSCPYSLAKLSSCNITDLILASDQQIYVASDAFGGNLLTMPCP